MSTSITNFAHPTRMGFIKLAPSGKEFFGTVIRAGKMQKTVTVSYSFFSCIIGANFKMGLQLQSRSVVQHK